MFFFIHHKELCFLPTYRMFVLLKPFWHIIYIFSLHLSSISLNFFSLQLSGKLKYTRDTFFIYFYSYHFIYKTCRYTHPMIVGISFILLILQCRTLLIHSAVLNLVSVDVLTRRYPSHYKDRTFSDKKRCEET